MNTESPSLSIAFSRSEIGDILQTGFDEFDTNCDVKGLASESPDGLRLDILTVVAESPGVGQFRTFMQLAKEKYKSISFLYVENPILRDALVRYGFSWDSIRISGVNNPGYIWRKES